MSAGDDVAELEGELEEVEAQGVHILRTVREPTERASALGNLFAKRNRARKALQAAYHRYALADVPDTGSDAEEAVTEILEELGLSAWRVAFAILFAMHSMLPRTSGTPAHTFWITVPGLPDGLVYAPADWNWSSSWDGQ